MKRGEIYYADLSPVVGSEQGGTRPVLVVQNDVGNKYAPTVIVCPIAASRKKALPTHVFLSGLKNDSIAMLEQVKTIDKTRIGSFIREASEEEMLKVDRALAVSIGLHKGEKYGTKTNRKS